MPDGSADEFAGVVRQAPDDAAVEAFVREQVRDRSAAIVLLEACT